MNGADLLCDTLLGNDVDVCFANPGTSEMHFCAALDRKPQMRCVLGLFEGVVTGAADGYARMAGKPAATLLHTGPGLANGLANIHNAKRARTPMINIVGDHASHHLRYDAPLTSDIEGLARPMSHWVKNIETVDDIVSDANAAYIAAVATPGIATLILPADIAWGDAPAVKAVRSRMPPIPSPSAFAIAQAVRALRSGRRVALHLSGSALRADALRVAGRIAAATGARLTAQNANGRIERGAGRVAVEKVPYAVEPALEFLKDIDILIRVGSAEPVAFFGYPGKPSRLTREGCEIMEMAAQGCDLLGALQWLAEELGILASAHIPVAERTEPLTWPRSGKLTDGAIAAIAAARMPENAIICDESLTSAVEFYALSKASAPHDYLQITGGAIGIGTPLSAGAAVACPDRKVIGLQADGSAMYTIQGLWTQARENLDVVTILFNNGAYKILHGEMRNVGVEDFGRNAKRMLNLDEPGLDWLALSKGLGVEAGRATTIEEFSRLFEGAMSRRGPYLIEAVI